MTGVVLVSLRMAILPVVLAHAAPSTASVRVADDPEPQRRSREDVQGAPIQMGAGPTALAMMALIAAVVARLARRRRADSTAAS